MARPQQASRMPSILAVPLLWLAGCTLPPEPPVAPAALPQPAETGRTIRAEVVALDQPITYNRFGSVNPYGMMYALARDVVEAETGLPVGASTCPGEVRLRDGRRPRPLVLRANEGDTLEITFRNLLLPRQPDLSGCDWVDIAGPDPATRRYPAGYPYADDYGKLAEPDDTGEPPEPVGLGPDGRPADGADWPRTRTASIAIAGLTPVAGRPCDAAEDDWFDASDPRVSGIEAIPPGACFVYRYRAERTGTHLFFSNGAPSGGEGDGGSLVHGLFGALHVEPAGSRWFRSQVSAEELAYARSRAVAPAFLAYDALRDGEPVLDLLKPVPGEDRTYELVHGDLTAIILDCIGDRANAPVCRDPDGNPKPPASREFTVIFHDELKTFYADAFRELETYQLESVGDGFAINYGASGMGTILLANRKGIGPAKDCLECFYEEFFLQSWANGDPALLPEFADDPSNVYHSYLGDRVEFRNLHAGPKETHVFHLHAHQWLAQREDEPERERGTYLDSQTIAPQQGFSYEIYYGGSGNRNLTPGDSIFHCHLYPHFAQGMWALWRVHDVFEDGTRRLPDGELGPGTDPMTGETTGGTPIPAVVPLPGQALPPAPTYGEDGFPGYPFYIPGEPGHRAPQPPLDVVEDGGLPRHVFTGEGERAVSGLAPDAQAEMTPEELVAFALASGDFSAELEEAEIVVLDPAGEPEERRAMAVHAADVAALPLPTGEVAVRAGRGYRSRTPEGAPALFRVNAASPKPGAPFADPCIADPDGKFGPVRTRRYDVAAIQLDLVVNEAGWHDPQARVNVLAAEADALEGTTTADVEPFFFRAESGECIEFRHTNRTPKDLELDDFQVRTPTDTIGQHIHLVKFDVTASDGSANGFNYEDGTLAPDAVLERLCAARAHGGWKRRGRDGLEALPAQLRLDEFCEAEHPDLARFRQTTVQRWYADPLTGTDTGPDRTIRTVFTHDHFAPSSIQQHGFYAALLVEPAGSEWFAEDGARLCDGDALDAAIDCQPAVGSRAIVKGAGDPELHPDHREFAMAIADFALLYSPHTEPAPTGEEAKGLDRLVAEAGDLPEETRLALAGRRDAIRARHGVPVDPPLLPEGISKNHHNPYVVNYRNAPIPLRIGAGGEDRAGRACDADELVRRVEDFRAGTWQAPHPSRQAAAPKGDPANVFSSAVHGDPCTPILEAYEGERLQLRVIQGAQEVQHMLAIQGMAWRREVANPDSPLVAAQEIGISEHFEMALPPLDNVTLGSDLADYLWRFDTQDAMWNGAWGFIRSYDGAQAPDPAGRTATIGERLAPVGEAEVDDRIVNFEQFTPRGVNACPMDADTRLFVVEAWSVRDWLDDGSGRRAYLFYDRNSSIADWHALFFAPVYAELFLHDPETGMSPAKVFVQAAEGAFDAPAGTAREALRAKHREAYARGGDPVEPLVLRARAGECIVVRLVNRLPDPVPDDAFDADAPRITSLNLSGVQPSAAVSLTPQLVNFNVPFMGGARVGRNPDLGDETILAAPNEAATYVWYAGTIELEPAVEPGKLRLVAEPRAFENPAALVSLADPMEHGEQGLIGALVIEEAGTTPRDPETGAERWAGGTDVTVERADGSSFREFVLLYQDGLNLRWRGEPIPDCLICDDSYDRGEKAANYRTAPFWARLGGQPESELNAFEFPPDFFTPRHRRVPTPRFSARAGEEVVFRVVQPHGRARQRAFLVLGHDYPELLPQFGSPHSVLIAPGKGITARLDSTATDGPGGVAPGYWLWRDGPAQHVSGGVWGTLEVSR